MHHNYSPIHLTGESPRSIHSSSLSNDFEVGHSLPVPPWRKAPLAPPLSSCTPSPHRLEPPWASTATGRLFVDIQHRRADVEEDDARGFLGREYRGSTCSPLRNTSERRTKRRIEGSYRQRLHLRFVGMVSERAFGPTIALRIQLLSYLLHLYSTDLTAGKTWSTYWESNGARHLDEEMTQERNQHECRLRRKHWWSRSPSLAKSFTPCGSENSPGRRPLASCSGSGNSPSLRGRRDYHDCQRWMQGRGVCNRRLVGRMAPTLSSRRGSTSKRPVAGCNHRQRQGAEEVFFSERDGEPTIMA